MKIVNIIGGLGNQMFQYAFALALEHYFPDEKIKLDISAFKGYPLHNGLEIFDIFPNKFEFATFRDIIMTNYPVWNYKSWQIRRHILPKLPKVIMECDDMKFEPYFNQTVGNTYYDGYWQDHQYFDEARTHIIKSMIFPIIKDNQNKILLQEISNCESVSIHIRRGDYNNHPLFGNICTLDYYQRAIQCIKEKIIVSKFIIFSNDQEWCKKNLKDSLGDTEKIFVDWNIGTNSFRDMQMMSLCKHNIIANSTFSWWGAWLNDNPDKIIVAPSRWINKNDSINIVPSSWIKL